MKRLVLTVILAASVGVTAQKQAKRIDEFGFAPCGDLTARSDGLAQHLAANPAADAKVVLFAPKTGKDRTKAYRELIRGRSLQAGVSLERIQFYRSVSDKLGGEFWLVGQDSRFEPPDATLWPEPSLDLTRASIYGLVNDPSICGTFAPRVYADILKTHEDIKGNIVVYAQSRQIARATVAEWLQDLTERLGVNRRQLRVFTRVDRKHDIGTTEFWLVPTRK